MQSDSAILPCFEVSASEDVESNHINIHIYILEALFQNLIFQYLTWTVSFARTSSLDSFITPPKVLKLDFERKKPCKSKKNLD